ncbi:hypothetical protein EON82_00940 [bacterium]|nr:MAG: hypothetical protein EON82_00940 [bacterium]
MSGQRLAKVGILAIFAAPVAFVVLTTYRFGFSSTWRMDPIPFAFFIAVSGFAGWILGRTR